MIKVTDMRGTAHYLNQIAIAQVSEPPPSAQYRGVGAYVKMVDGVMIECMEKAVSIFEAIEAQNGK